ncbi:17295_t:CDS:2, partial [Entrophospora sp. SA101]
RLTPTSAYVESLISIQRAYINTNHPDFIGGAAATKSSPSPQKKSSQSHKRALSTEIVYKLLGN